MLEIVQRCPTGHSSNPKVVILDSRTSLGSFFWVWIRGSKAEETLRDAEKSPTWMKTLSMMDFFSQKLSGMKISVTSAGISLEVLFSSIHPNSNHPSITSSKKTRQEIGEPTFLAKLMNGMVVYYCKSRRD